MSRVQLSAELKESISSIGDARVQEIARELAGYGLGIALPHIHLGSHVEPLPSDKIQYENDLAVSFLNRADLPTTGKGFPVAWRYADKEQTVVPCAWCHDT